jgi:hypothetical protein
VLVKISKSPEDWTRKSTKSKISSTVSMCSCNNESIG